AMIRIFNTFAREGLKSKMILQVHDELIFDVLEEERKRVSEIVEREMKGALPMTVPIEVEINFADNWLDAH
ncbi:MAG: DNA polymerase, partial [Bacteroidales bacterium]